MSYAYNTFFFITYKIRHFVHGTSLPVYLLTPNPNGGLVS